MCQIAFRCSAEPNGNWDIIYWAFKKLYPGGLFTYMHMFNWMADQ